MLKNCLNYLSNSLIYLVMLLLSTVSYCLDLDNSSVYYFNAMSHRLNQRLLHIILEFLSVHICLTHSVNK